MPVLPARGGLGNSSGRSGYQDLGAFVYDTSRWRWPDAAPGPPRSRRGTGRPGASTMCKTKAYSAASDTSPLASTTIPRRDPTERDVQIEILFCGICHSDVHAV